jgi:hypothetical protein
MNIPNYNNEWLKSLDNLFSPPGYLRWSHAPHFVPESDSSQSTDTFTDASNSKEELQGQPVGVEGRLGTFSQGKESLNPGSASEKETKPMRRDKSSSSENVNKVHEIPKASLAPQNKVKSTNVPENGMSDKVNAKDSKLVQKEDTPNAVNINEVSAKKDDMQQHGEVKTTADDPLPKETPSSVSVQAPNLLNNPTLELTRQNTTKENEKQRISDRSNSNDKSIRETNPAPPNTSEVMRHMSNGISIPRGREFLGGFGLVRVEVCVKDLYVHDSSDDPGSYEEWNMDVSVQNVEKQYHIINLEVPDTLKGANASFPIHQCRKFTLPAPKVKAIKISAKGFEDDDFTANDDLGQSEVTATWDGYFSADIPDNAPEDLKEEEYDANVVSLKGGAEGHSWTLTVSLRYSKANN